MSKTKPDSASKHLASPGPLTLPGRTLDQPALPVLPEPVAPAVRGLNASRALTAAEFLGLAAVASGASMEEVKALNRQLIERRQLLQTL